MKLNTWDQGVLEGGETKVEVRHRFSDQTKMMGGIAAILGSHYSKSWMLNCMKISKKWTCLI